MEVHAHSHTARKKWTHYFWEFLMLFLAVFCGFLAEYQLEHKIEKERGKQYIRSFYDELRFNVGSLSWILKSNEIKSDAFRDIFPCYDTLTNKPANTSCLANMLKQSTYFITVAFADGTLGQLKNAGGLRLLDKEDRDSVIAYDHATRNYRDWEATVMQHSQDNVRNTFDELGDFRSNRFLYSDSVRADEIPVLYGTDKSGVNKLFNVLFRYRQHITRQNRWMTELRNKINTIIKYFDSKYHFQ